LKRSLSANGQFNEFVCVFAGINSFDRDFDEALYWNAFQRVHCASEAEQTGRGIAVARRADLHS
jgi:hypothetical protein